MEENHTKNGKLIATLSILIVIIIALIVGIVVFYLNKPSEPDTEPEPEIVLTPEEQAMLEKDQADMDAWETEYQAYENTIANIRAKADTLLQQTPPDTDSIDELYTAQIKEYIAKEDLLSAESATYDERNYFLEHDMKAEALKYLTAKDFTIYPEEVQYPFYFAILTIAEELNDAETTAKYQPLLNQTKPAWDASMQEIEEYDIDNN